MQRDVVYFPVWNNVKNDLPPLIKEIEKILN